MRNEMYSYQTYVFIGLYIVLGFDFTHSLQCYSCNGDQTTPCGQGGADNLSGSSVFVISYGDTSLTACSITYTATSSSSYSVSRGISTIGCTSGRSSSTYTYCCNVNYCNSISFPVPSNNKPPACVACDTTGNGQNTCISSGIVTYGSPTYSCMIFQGTANGTSLLRKSYLQACVTGTNVYYTYNGIPYIGNLYCCNSYQCNSISIPSSPAPTITCLTCDTRIEGTTGCDGLLDPNSLGKNVYRTSSGESGDSCAVIVGLSTSNTLAFTIRTYIANCADAYDTLTFDGTLIRVHCCQTDLCNYVNVSFVIESTTSNATYSPDQADSGLSGGAIAGIVIGVVAAVVIAAIIIGCILYFCSHRRTTTAAPRKESQKAIYTIPRNNRQNPGGRYEDDYHQSSPRNYRQNQDVQYEDDYHQPSPRNYRQDTDVIIVDDYHPVSPRNYYQNGGIQYDDD